MEYLTFDNWPYVAWVATVTYAFYRVTAFATSDLHPDKKAALTLWLEGSYESTWSTQFCDAFDRIFGRNHLRFRCILLSTAFSFVAVIALWLLFDPILGLISLRADTSLHWTKALLLGAAINIIPDYFSLYETRWILKKFERITNPFGQFLALILDAVVSGAIIFIGIMIFIKINGQLQISNIPETSLIEMVAVFSVYSVFFYSTFLTSVWAWVYCLSSWLARFSARLRNWSDLNGNPGEILARLVALFVMLGALLMKPIFTMDEEGRAALDGFLCTAFPSSTCTHVARLTKDEQQRLEYLKRACLGGATEECLETAFAIIDIDPVDGSLLLAKACNSGIDESCTYLGISYQYGEGVEKNLDRAIDLFERACSGTDPFGCMELASIFEDEEGDVYDQARAIRFQHQGCDGGAMVSCHRLGFTYLYGIGIAPDGFRAANLFREACDGGVLGACTNLGGMYESGDDVKLDYFRAVELYEQACDGSEPIGCLALGLMHEGGRGVTQNEVHAATLYQRVCDDGEPIGCEALAISHSRQILEDVEKQCFEGDAIQCLVLGASLKNQENSTADMLARTAKAYQEACKLGDPLGCTELKRIRNP